MPTKVSDRVKRIFLVQGFKPLNWFKSLNRCAGKTIIYIKSHNFSTSKKFPLWGIEGAPYTFIANHAIIPMPCSIAASSILNVGV